MFARPARVIPKPTSTVLSRLNNVVVDGVRLDKLDDQKFKFIVLGGKYQRLASAAVVNELLSTGQWPAHVEKLAVLIFKEYPKYLEFELKNPASIYKPAQSLREWIAYLLWVREVAPEEVQGLMDSALVTVSKMLDNVEGADRGDGQLFLSVLDGLIQASRAPRSGAPVPPPHRPTPLPGAHVSQVVSPKSGLLSFSHYAGAEELKRGPIPAAVAQKEQKAPRSP